MAFLVLIFNMVFSSLLSFCKFLWYLLRIFSFYKKTKKNFGALYLCYINKIAAYVWLWYVLGFFCSKELRTRKQPPGMSFVCRKNVNDRTWKFIFLLHLFAHKYSYVHPFGNILRYSYYMLHWENNNINIIGNNKPHVLVHRFCIFSA